jgi:hypothetical protein
MRQVRELVRTQPRFDRNNQAKNNQKRGTTLSRKRHLATSKINDLSHVGPLAL